VPQPVDVVVHGELEDEDILGDSYFYDDEPYRCHTCSETFDNPVEEKAFDDFQNFLVNAHVSDLIEELEEGNVFWWQASLLRKQIKLDLEDADGI
jgi:hypothetical protein